MTRLVGIDVARCLALLGMVATHLLDPRTPDGGLAFAQSVAGGRASALFAVLAGVSIALLTGRRTPVSGPERVARSAGLAVRTGLVALVGLALAELDSGLAIILAYYGLLFLCALPFLGLGARSLFALAAGWMVAGPVLSHLVRPSLPARGWASPSFESLTEPAPLLADLLFTGYYPVVPWVAYLLLGLAVGRLDLASRAVAAMLTVAGGVLSAGAVLVSDALTRRDDVVRALLADQPSYLPRTTDGPALLDLVAGGMYGTTPAGAWEWLLVRAPHSGTPFDLVLTGGGALLVIGGCLLLVGALPVVAGRAVAVLFGAGTATLTLYSLHAVMRSDVLPPATEPAAFLWHVLVLGGIGAALVALGWRGPLERAVGAVSTGVSGVVRAVDRSRPTTRADDA